MLRSLIRNLTLKYLPATLSYNLNIWKNIKNDYLEAEMPYVDKLLNEIYSETEPLVTIDIGANLGLFSYILSKYSSIVYAIEPQPRLAKYLSKVVPINVEIMNVGISNSQGFASLKIPRIGRFGGIVSQQDALATIERHNPVTKFTNVDHIEIRIDTLDNILKNCNRVDFIKVDVEGHELSVLMGSTFTIENFRPFFMIEIFKPHNPNANLCFDLLFSKNYLSFYCTSSGIKICLNQNEIDQIINNPEIDDRIITNFFFIPIEKKEVIEKLFL